MTALTVTGFCPLPHHVDPERLRTVRDDAAMCSGHIKQGRTALCELTVRYEQLVAHLEPARIDDGEVLRAEIREHLYRSADRVADVMQDGGPHEYVVHRVIAYLLMHHEEVVALPWAPEYVEQLRDIARRAWRLLHPYRGALGLPLPCPDMRCSGSVVPAPGVLPPYRRQYADTLITSRGAMICDTCRVDVPTGKWRNVARRLLVEAVGA